MPPSQVTQQVRGSLRALRLVLALLMVPVVVFSVPNVAQAATAYSTSATGKLAYNEDASRVGGSLVCSFNGYWQVPEGPGTPIPSLKVVGGNCEPNFWVQINVGGPDCDADDCSTVAGDFRGLRTSDQSACSVPFSFDVGTIDWKFSGVVPASVADCDVTQVCTSVFDQYVNNGNDGSLQGDGCEPFALGPPPGPPPASAPTSSCEHFDPTSVRVWTDNPKAYPAYTGYAAPTGASTILHFEVRGVRKTAAAKMKVSALMAKTAGGEEWVGWQPENALAAGNGWESWSSISLNGAWSRVIGVHLMSAPYDTQIDAGQDALAHKREIPFAPASSAMNGWRYDNDPTNCLWWFGDKRHVEEAGTMDDPHAQVLGAGVDETPTNQTEPAPGEAAPAALDGDPCEFTLSDPTTWASAGICKLVAIISGIPEWFRPHPDQWGWQELKAQAEARPPYSVIADVAAAGTGISDGFKAGECGVLAEVQIEGNRAAFECTAIKSTPNYGALYSLTQVGFWVMCGLGLFKMFSGMLESGS